MSMSNGKVSEEDSDRKLSSEALACRTNRESASAFL